MFLINNIQKHYYMLRARKLRVQLRENAQLLACLTHPSDHAAVEDLLDKRHELLRQLQALHLRCPGGIYGNRK